MFGRSRAPRSRREGPRFEGFEKSNFFNVILRFLQFVFGLAVVGLYGQDLNNARKAHVYADGKWVRRLITLQPR